jgi:hypothetical protein
MFYKCCVSVYDYYVPGVFRVPRRYRNTHGIVSETVVSVMADTLGLTAPGLRGCDFACGSNAIGRVLWKKGVSRFDVGDIDEDNCRIAYRQRRWLRLWLWIRLRQRVLGKVFRGADLATATYAGPYDYAYFSPPFMWFAGPDDPPVNCAEACARLVKLGGRVVIDSAESVVRDGVVIRVAEQQIAHFVGSGHFKLVAIYRFTIIPGRRGLDPRFDSEFIELVFERVN